MPAAKLKYVTDKKLAGLSESEREEYFLYVNIEAQESVLREKFKYKKRLSEILERGKYRGRNISAGEREWANNRLAEVEVEIAEVLAKIDGIKAGAIDRNRNKASQLHAGIKNAEQAANKASLSADLHNKHLGGTDLQGHDLAHVDACLDVADQSEKEIYDSELETRTLQDEINELDAFSRRLNRGREVG